MFYIGLSLPCKYKYAKFVKYNFDFSCSLTKTVKTPPLSLYILLAVTTGVEFRGGIQLQIRDLRAKLQMLCACVYMR